MAYMINVSTRDTNEIMHPIIEIIDKIISSSFDCNKIQSFYWKPRLQKIEQIPGLSPKKSTQ